MARRQKGSVRRAASRKPDEGALAGVRERLGAAGYGEAQVAGRLGVPHIVALSLDRYPIYEARLAAREPLDVAISLFLLQGEASRQEAEGLLGAESVAALLAHDLLESVGRGRSAPLAATASLYPCAGAIFATDHRWRPSARHERRAPAEPVMYLGGDSYGLAYLAPRRAVGSALDLCTGSGVHAILAARHAQRVVAVDLSPRALAFAKLNAALNGVSGRIDWRRGDLYAPVPEGGKFDLVLANPPFVPTPHAGRARVGFRDAGPAGEEVIARLLAGLPEHLAREGTAAVVSIFAEGDEPYRGKLERWLPRGTEMSALLLRFGADAPADYAQGQTRRAYGDTLEEHRARHARWVEAMRRAGVRRLSGGVLALRAHAGATPSWWRTLDVPWPTRAFPDELDRLFRACEAARGIVFADELLDRTARAAPDLLLVDELEQAEGGLSPRRHRARAGAGLAPEVGISPELRALLSGCNGERPLRAVVEEIAAATQADPRGLAERLVPDLLELAERGLLSIDKG